MNALTESTKQAIDNLNQNIEALERTIKFNCFQPGYIKNCKEQIQNYKKQIEQLENSQKIN